MSEKAKRESRYYPEGLLDKVRRLAIFQCYDKDGIIDDYIPYLLRDLKENLETLVIVVNGKLLPESRAVLHELTPHVLVRVDEGIDAAAWKETMINYLGWDKVAEYDELILLNDTFFGPLYPFREVFDEMAKRPVDFWGLIAHNESPWGNPEFIQSFFLVVRRAMTTSYEFKTYWENQPVYSYEEAVVFHEQIFTKHFEDAGFVWDVYVNVLSPEQSKSACVDHNRFNQFWLLSEHRFPILKRKNFILPYLWYLNISNGSDCKKSLDYVMQETNYDCRMVFRNILRVYNIADLFTNLHLQYILPKESVVQKQRSGSRAVMVFSLYYMERLDDLQPYISSIPLDVDVILVVKPKESLNIAYQKFSPTLGDRLRVVLAENPGKNLSALLVAAAPYLKEYDFIGFCHDKGPHKGEPITISRDFQELLVENTIGSGAYVENVLNLLDNHPELGFLAPPPPQHGFYFGSFIDRFWDKGCFEQTKALGEKLALNVDITKDKWPLALGTAFWCRRDALAPLLDYPWSYDDFPPEPLPADGTVIHALERIFPFVAQHQGYLSGWVMTDEYAALEINNMHYRIDQLLHSSSDNPVMQIGLKGALINYVKKHLPKPLWGIARKIKHLLRW